MTRARDRFVELDRDRDVITRVKAPAHQLGSDVTNGVSITSLCDDMTLAPRPRLDGASIRRQRIPPPTVVDWWPFRPRGLLRTNETVVASDNCHYIHRG